MEFTGSVAGGVAGMLNIKGDGDEVTITPVLTSGVKVATIVLNEGKPDEESFDLYAPEGVSSYADLSDKPSINGHTLSGNQSSSDLELFSGSYNDLSNKPTLNGAAISGNMYSFVISSTPHIVGTWIDGKPIYCKHINFGSQISIGSNQWYYYPDYDASHIRNMVNAICLVRPNGDLQNPAKDVKCFDVGVDNDQLTFLTLRNATDYISDVIIFYTDNQDYT